MPDDVTIRLVMSWISAPEQSDGFVLDGFPRTLPQAEALDGELEGGGGLDRVLYVNVAEDETYPQTCGTLHLPDLSDTLPSDVITSQGRRQVRRLWR